MTKVKNKEVLYLSYDGLTDPLGQSQVIPYLVGLSNNGYVVTVVSAEKKKNFAEKKSQIQILCDDAGIDWQPVAYTKSPPAISTLKDVYAMYRKSMQLYKVKKFSLVHSRSYIAALIGLRLKRKLGLKFLFDMRGFWANERVDGKIWNIEKQPYKAIYTFFKKKEIEFFKEADHIVSLTENGAKEILSWKEFKDNKLPITVIPCCVDRNRFSRDKVKECDLDDLRNKFQFKDKFVLSYLGSIGTWYMLDEMLDFFKVLKASKPNAVFFFVSGESPEYIQKKANEKGIDSKDIVVVKANYTEVPLYISLATLAIFFIKPAYSKKASSPVKQGELMSMGIPIVCNDLVGDTDLIVEKYACGYVVKSFDQKSYQKIVDKMLENTLPPENGVRGAQDYFSLEKGVDLYNAIYKELI